MEWESQTGMCRWSTSTFENSCGCTALDMPEWRETTEQTDWQAKHLSQVVCSASRKIWSVEKLETLPAGTKPRTSHHWSPEGERRWTTIFLKRTRESHRQSDEHWNRFKGNVRETSERWGSAYEPATFQSQVWYSSHWAIRVCVCVRACVRACVCEISA